MNANKIRRRLYRCPVCAKVSSVRCFEAGKRGDETHALLALDMRFVGGGRTPRKYDGEGNPIPDGKQRGFVWTRRHPTRKEQREIFAAVQAVAQRLLRTLEGDVK